MDRHLTPPSPHGQAEAKTQRLLREVDSLRKTYEDQAQRAEERGAAARERFEKQLADAEKVREREGWLDSGGEEACACDCCGGGSLPTTLPFPPLRSNVFPHHQSRHTQAHADRLAALEAELRAANEAKAQLQQQAASGALVPSSSAAPQQPSAAAQALTALGGSVGLDLTERLGRVVELENALHAERAEKERFKFFAQQ